LVGSEIEPVAIEMAEPPACKISVLRAGTVPVMENTEGLVVLK
jgi:hypothetical protein